MMPKEAIPCVVRANFVQRRRKGSKQCPCGDVTGLRDSQSERPLAVSTCTFSEVEYEEKSKEPTPSQLIMFSRLFTEARKTVRRTIFLLLAAALRVLCLVDSGSFLGGALRAALKYGQDPIRACAEQLRALLNISRGVVIANEGTFVAGKEDRADNHKPQARLHDPIPATPTGNRAIMNAAEDQFLRSIRDPHKVADVLATNCSADAGAILLCDLMQSAGVEPVTVEWLEGLPATRSHSSRH